MRDDPSCHPSALIPQPFSSMRIGLTYNLKAEQKLQATDPDDRFEEFDSLETIEGLENAFREHGHTPVRLGWGAAMLDRLRETKVDGVFNLAEGIGGRGRESQVPATLEMMGIPCSGADAVAIGITLDKALAKLLAKANGIPTAPFAVNEGSNLRYPLFAKPACEGSSMGITSSSLCRDERELNAALKRLAVYGPTLIEEFLPGEEFTVGIIGGEVLGVMQVVPRSAEPDFIYSLEVSAITRTGSTITSSTGRMSPT